VQRGEVAVLVKRAIEVAAGQVEDLAAEAGISKHTLYAWAAGRRRAPAEKLERFAAVLRRRSGELAALAADLDRAAERREA
jgi:AcrR family transcriptional regulator